MSELANEAMVEAPSDPPPEAEVEMSLMEHLEELRRRLVYALLGLLPGLGLAWAFKESLLDLLVTPLSAAWKVLGLGEPQLHFASPIDPFVAYLKLSFVAGLLIASPWVFWQLWSFISPGLYRKEKRLALPFVLASTFFFISGAVFGYRVVFPLLFETLLSFSGPLPGQVLALQPTLMMTEYIGFTSKLLLGFGVVFEVPVVVTFLSLAGLVSARAFLRFGRWWVVIAAFLSAFLTPPDVGSQLLMLIPLVVLYFASVGLAFVIEWRRGRRAARADKEST